MLNKLTNQLQLSDVIPELLSAVCACGGEGVKNLPSPLLEAGTRGGGENRQRCDRRWMLLAPGECRGVETEPEHRGGERERDSERAREAQQQPNEL